jgi:hypothetical protein
VVERWLDFKPLMSSAATCADEGKSSFAFTTACSPSVGVDLRLRDRGDLRVPRTAGRW